MKVQVLKSQAVIADQCDVAESFFIRLFGLMGKTQLSKGQGLWFERCNSIHMWFMRMSLDVVFMKKLDSENHYEVTSLYSNVKPWKLIPLFDFKATDVLEIQSGSIQKSQLRIGDRLCID